MWITIIGCALFLCGVIVSAVELRVNTNDEVRLTHMPRWVRQAVVRIFEQLWTHPRWIRLFGAALIWAVVWAVLLFVLTVDVLNPMREMGIATSGFLALVYTISAAWSSVVRYREARFG